MKKTRGFFLGLAILIGMQSESVYSAEFAKPQEPIVDQAAVFPSRQRQLLNELLREFNAKGKAQIGILTLSSLKGRSIEELSIRVAEDWKLGAEKEDNGIVIVLAPTEKKVRIEVGQGLEGIIPDAYAKRILAEVARPYFKKGLYADGLSATVMQLALIIDKDFADSGRQVVANPSEEGFPNKAGLFFILFFIIFPFLSFISRFNGRGSGRRGGPFIGGYGGGGWSGSSGGGWSGGGGGFSGGGASDGW